MFMFICWLSPNKKKKYTVLEFTKLEYCVNFFFFKRYSSLVYSSTMLHGTRVYQARVPQFFLIAQIPTQQCHGGRTDE